MGRSLVALACVAAMLTMAAPASGETPQGAAERAQAAFDKVDALAATLRQQGDFPRFSNPQSAPALEALYDMPGLLGAPPYTKADVPALLTIGDLHNRLFSAYANFARAGESVDEARNVVEFQDEITRSIEFITRQWGAMIPALEDFVAGLPADQMTPVRREGLRKMHDGLQEFISGVATVMTSDGVRPENRRRIAAAFRDNGVAIAAGLTPAVRRVIAERVGAMIDKVDEESRASLRAFIEAMGGKDCGALCSVE